jgi:hypothetical protein
LAELEAMGFVVTRDDDGAVVCAPGSKSACAVHAPGGWLRIALAVADSEELASFANREALVRWVLEFQDRYLGCRFAFDAEGALGVVADVYPSQQNGSALAETINQVSYVAEALQPLLERALAGGRLPTDEDVDAAFADAEIH